MRRLANYHVPRPRLIALALARPVTVVEAGGGYGKSSLAVEVARSLGCATAELLITPRDREAALLLEKLQHALRRAGISPATQPSADLDGLLDALERDQEELLLVVDDAHLADAEGAELVRRLAEIWPSRHRLILLGRRVGPTPGATRIGPAELAFTGDEIVELYERFDIALGTSDVDALAHASGGWAAGLMLAARTYMESPNATADIQRLARRPLILGALLDEQLSALAPADRAVLPELAHLPILTPDVVAAIGVPGLLDRALRAGVPFMTTAGARVELPGSLQELLAERGKLTPETAERAAHAYVRLGEPMAAVDLLLDAGLPSAAAELLGGFTPEQVDLLPPAALESAVALLPDEVVRAQPMALLQLARASELDHASDRRDEALARAAAVLGGDGDPALRREVDAERALDLARAGRVDEAELLAHSVLDAAGPDELPARARGLEALGRAAAWWRSDDGALAEAEPLLKESAALARRAGRSLWAAQALVALAYGVYFAQVRPGPAAGRLEEALELLPARSSYRAVTLTLYANVLIDLVRFDEARASLEEARSIGLALRDDVLTSYTSWSGAALAAAEGDRAGAVELLHEVDRGGAEWREGPIGVNFLAEAADLLAGLGETELASAFLDRACARRDVSASSVERAEAAWLAYCGDPSAAETLLVRLLEDAPVRHRLRLTLLRAYAAYRRADPAAAALAARVFGDAAELGHETLPLVRDRAAAEALLALAADAGSRAAARLLSRRLPFALRLLGGFDVTIGGRSLELPAGRPAQLVKLLGSRGGRVPADEAIEWLWPEVEPASGRKRLRNVLNRLRAAGDLVEREGEILVLAAGYVDVAAFEADAERAFKLAAAGERARGAALARSALARYRGPLLPDDRYESWAAVARERLERRYVGLLDLLARHSEAAGDVAEAVQLLERAIEVDPLDEQLYVRAGRLLVAQGRRLAAVSLAVRCSRVFDGLGLPTPPELHELAAAAHAASVSS